MEGLAWRSDAELVQGVGRGDNFAFGQLFERWFDRVLAVAQNILGDPQEAAEVATDTFHSLWHHLGQLGDPEGFGPWALETSRAFAHDRLAARAGDEERERHPPIPLVLGLAELTATVAGALASRGVPSMAAGTAGPATSFAPAGLLPSAGPSAGSAGPAAPAGAAGGVPARGGILGGSVENAAAATEAMTTVPGGVHLASGPASPRRFLPADPASAGGVPALARIMIGALVTVVVVAAGTLVWLLSQDEGADDGASQVAAQEQEPESPITVGGAAAGAGAGAGDDDVAATSSSTSVPTSASSLSSSTTTRASSTTRRASSSTATTRASTTSTSASTTATTAPTSATTVPTSATTVTTTPTTAPTSATTTPTSPTTTPTTPSTTPTTPSTTPTTPSTTPTTLAPPTIDSFTTVAGNADCPVGRSSWIVRWSATDATTAEGSVLTAVPQAYSGKATGSFSFCAPVRTAVTIKVTGPGGSATDRTTTG